MFALHESQSTLRNRQLVARHIGLWASFVGATLFVGACESVASSADGVTERDSSGVSIIANHAQAWSNASRWHISTEPTITTDHNSSQPLFDVRGAVRLATGMILVANSSGNQLQLYDDSGRYVRSIGGIGSGPGEFTGLSRIWRYRGDSVLAFDIHQFRLSVFSVDGVFGRTLRLDPYGDFPLPIPVGVFPDGSVLVRSATNSLTQDELGSVNLEMHLGEWSASGAFIQSFGTFFDREVYYFSSERGPFPNTPLLQRKSNVVSMGDQFVIASSDKYEWRSYSRPLNLDRIVRKDHLSLEPSSSDISKLTELVLEMATSPQMRAEIEAEIRVMPVHETFPAFGWPALPENFWRRSVLSDLDGSLWVLEYEIPNQTPLTWTIFATDGRLQATVDVPHNFEVFEAGIDYVLGVMRDELGTEVVQVYSLEKPGSVEDS